MNPLDNDGATPVFVAVGAGQVRVVRVFAERGANLATPNANGTTPIEVAEAKENAEIIAVINSFVPDRLTPQSSASCRDDREHRFVETMSRWINGML
jgi:ankyrin repeat protein